MPKYSIVIPRSRSIIKMIRVVVTLMREHGASQEEMDAFVRAVPLKPEMEALAAIREWVEVI